MLHSHTGMKKEDMAIPCQCDKEVDYSSNHYEYHMHNRKEEGAREELPIYMLNRSQPEKLTVNLHLTAKQTYQMENLMQELEKKLQ